MRKILAFIDASPYGASVCDHAAWAAQKTGAAVDVFHVLGRREIPSAPADYTGSLDANSREDLLSELSAHDEERSRLAQKRGRLILDQAKARLLATGVSQVETKLRHGDILETVEEFERTADLIAIGKRGEAADFAKLHLGSNLERVVRTSQKPVLVASRAFKPISRVLVAFDGGPSILKAIDYLSRTPLLQDAACLLLRAGTATPEATTPLERAASQLVAAGYSTEIGVRPGSPETVISSAVETSQIDLLVMGAYGHSRIRNLIIGSTTTEMIRSCKIPVLLFR
ncbi:MAG: universal stress protein [Ferrovibrio sp.]|uniref:universal stress protein n=1 Tax=Ferrovibrio sp. TaxID=1917215 RepID=UPI00391D47C0